MNLRQISRLLVQPFIYLVKLDVILTKTGYSARLFQSLAWTPIVDLIFVKIPPCTLIRACTLIRDTRVLWIHVIDAICISDYQKYGCKGKM